MKKFFSALLVAGAFIAPASAQIYISTSCLSNPSFPTVGYCVSSSYGTDCNHYAGSGTACVGFRTIVDKLGI